MSKNGLASYGNPVSYVSLTHLPDSKTEYSINFDSLYGGLNIYDPDYRLNTNESPRMINMMWKNGLLCSRYGQAYATQATFQGEGVTTYNGLFNDNAFMVIGAHIVYGKPKETMSLHDLGYTGDPEQLTMVSGQTSYTLTAVRFGEVCEVLEQGSAGWSVNKNWSVSGTTLTFTTAPSGNLKVYYQLPRGTFFRYGDDLYYKAPGAFFKITYANSAFTMTNVATTAHTPITYINCTHSNGSGDSYQPENRLSSYQQLWYPVGTDQQTQTFTGDGTTVNFSITLSNFGYISDVLIDGATYGNWNLNTGNVLHFYTAPESGAEIEVQCQCAVTRYYLPFVPDSISSLTVRGTAQTAGTDYTWTSGNNYIDFTTVPQVQQPLDSNAIKITLCKANTTAYNNIMDCAYATVFGGDQNICIVMGGSKDQPNAFFWNGNTSVSMDAGYWPMEHYNLAGDVNEEITGFGKQQSLLVVFKNKSVGKGTMQYSTIESDSDDVTARTYIEIDYTNINSEIGCDLPWSIQLVENNLVFANTKQGVHILLDSSDAAENNIYCISRKVNGAEGRYRLTKELELAETVCSVDDNYRYWVLTGNTAYCWDYSVSTYSDPSWFYLTNIEALGFFKDTETTYHLNKAGRVTRFTPNVYYDYEAPVHREYQFATQYMGGYDRLKTVRTCIFTLRGDTGIDAQLYYLTDYETREDLTPITREGSWILAPMNLADWDTSVNSAFAVTARRRPQCKHVRHFGMRLVSEDGECDFPLLSAQVLYVYEGRDK